MKIELGEALEALTRLQRMMGVTDEPELPAPVLAQLVNEGIEAEFDEVPANFEGVLTWRGKIVVLYIQDQRGSAFQQSGYRFHVAECNTLERMRANSFGDRYIVTSRADGRFPVHPGGYGPVELRPMQVCKNCLRRVDWDGYRAAGPSEQTRIVASFDIGSFFQTYTNVRARRRPPNAPTPPPPPGPLVQRPAPPPQHQDAEAWAYSIDDDQFRRAALHVQRFGALTESELTQMVGNARRARRFSLSWEEWFAGAPFKVNVHVAPNGQKSYRRVSR